MSDSVRPHRWPPTRLLCSWDSPGKNTGVGCHFLLQCMKVKSESEVSQSCPTLSDLMDPSVPGSSVHGIFQARVQEWGAIAFSDKQQEEQTMFMIGRYIIGKMLNFIKLIYIFNELSGKIITAVCIGIHMYTEKLILIFLLKRHEKI